SPGGRDPRRDRPRRSGPAARPHPRARRPLDGRRGHAVTGRHRPGHPCRRAGEEPMTIEASGYAAPHRHAATRVHPAIRRVSRLLAPLAMVCVIGLLVAPWRQSVAGAGKVIAYDPTDRPQPIEAPIKGRIVAWHVQEGTAVDEGDLIAELVDNDAQILERLERERLAAADN